MIKIMFVCHGNICRSPMAEFVFKKLVSDAGREAEFEIASAATDCDELGSDIYPPAKRKLTEKHIPFSRRAATLLRRADYDEYDRFICMDNENLRHIRRILPSDPEGKISLLLKTGEVSDPWYTGDFEEAYQDILKGCRALLREL